MKASAAEKRAARNVLVFGPQALNFDSAAFPSLSYQLQRPEQRWLLDLVSSLSEVWRRLSNSLPVLNHVPGEDLLQSLSSALHTGVIPESLFPLPNFLLSPLVVIRQLVQYQTLFESAYPEYLDGRTASITASEDTEILGLCTGTLTAFAVACSSSRLDLHEHGAAAVRLAMAIGALVDAEDSHPLSAGAWGSISVSWSADELDVALDEVLQEFSDAYVSARVDERRFTVTAPKSTVPALTHKLKTIGMYVADIKLGGRFHWPKRHANVEALIRFCNFDTQFQLPNASQIVLPSRSETHGRYVNTGDLHEIALRSILLHQSNWIEVFGAFQSSQEVIGEHKFTCFGSERCVPPTLARKLGPSLSYVPDTGMPIPSRSTTPLLTSYTPPESVALPDERIAVVGMSCHAAGANDLEEFWDVLLSGQSQHKEVPEQRFSMETPWKPLDSSRKWYGNFIRDYDKFDHKFFKRSPREMASTDPQQRLAMKLAYQALEQSGYHASNPHDKHIGCYIGMGQCDYERNIACHPANAYSAKGNLKSFAAGNVSHHFGWTGPSMTIDSACSSSSVAIHHACRSIISGECTAALAGGVNVFTNPDWFHNLAGASFLSPTGQCKPFDAKADGYCRGEGAGFVFLKSLARAIADGDQIFGIIAGTRVYQNQNCTAITVPNAASLSTLFTDVLHQAKLEPNAISVVEAHGTGTPVGDPAEYNAIRTALSPSSRDNTLYLSSVKGSIGHCEFSSGVLSLIKVLLMIREGTIPPQASFTSINPALKAAPNDRIEIPTKPRPWERNFRAALINNYGASGSNASIIVTQSPTKYCLDGTTSPNISHSHPFWLSGLDDRAIRAYCAKLRRFLQRDDSVSGDLSIRNLSFQMSRQSNRSLPHGFVFSSKTMTDLQQQLVAFESSDKSPISTRVSPPRPVILCFGGQVSTFVGLDKVLYESVTLFRKHVDECNSTCLLLGLDSIFPSIFQQAPLENVVQLQTALFTLQYACAKTWVDCGVQVAAIVGHSFGELVGLCIAGAYSLSDALRLVACRADIVRRCWGNEKGAMLAIEADAGDVKKLLAKAQLVSGDEENPSIACYNGPRTFTIAGTAEAVDLLEDLSRRDLPSSKIKTKRLAVTNAYHSALVNPLKSELESLGQSVILKDPVMRVERATERPSKRLNSSFLAEHMRNPVYFSHAVQRLSQDFPSAIWLEAGSNSTVTAMASRALGGLASAHFQAINLSDNGSLDRIAQATTKLWKEGLNVSFWMHHKVQTSEYSPLILPPYQFEETEHWMELKAVPAIQAPCLEPIVDVPSSLTTFVGYQNQDKRSARFIVNTSMARFQELVSATHVLGMTCMPSTTLQLDIVIDAFSFLRPELKDFKLRPEIRDVVHKQMLLVDTAGDLYLDAVASDTDGLVWQWRLNAITSTSSSTDYTTGKIILWRDDNPQPVQEFDALQRLVSNKRCTDLLADVHADEVLQGRSIYQSLKTAVDWGLAYRHVTKVVGKGMETAGCVQRKSDGSVFIDSVLSECFCQIATCYLNLLPRNADRVLVCTHLQRLIRNPRLSVSSSLPEVWDVFVLHNQQSSNTYVTDIFAFDPTTGSLIEAILGVSYQDVAMEGLRKAFSRTAGTTGLQSKTTTAPVTSQEEFVSTSDTLFTTSTSAVLPVQMATTEQLSTAICKTSEPNVSEKTREILCNLSGIEPEEIKDDSDLIELGIDSLMAMEVVREVDIAFHCKLENEQLMELTDFQSLVTCIRSALGLGCENHDEGREEAQEKVAPEPMVQPSLGGIDSRAGFNAAEKNNQDSGSGGPVIVNAEAGIDLPPTINTPLVLSQATLIDEFQRLKAATDDYIRRESLDGYLTTTIPKLTEVCIVYFVEAFEQLGCPIRSAAPGRQLQRIPHLPKHQRFVDLIYHMLEHDARLVEVSGGEIKRTANPVPKKSADVLLTELHCDEPEHIAEYKLVATMGPRLGDCLIGRAEGVQILFSQAKEALANMYTVSPISRAFISQLESLIESIAGQLSSTNEPLCILEVGAGTCGTTNKLIAVLARLGKPVRYTMTDLSGSLVAAARRRFSHYPFMEFKVLDIESEPDAKLLASQHIILSTDCIHATRSLFKSVSNIHRMLRPDGFLVLLEMTRQLPWVDLVFGLLEGWWLFEDDRSHSIVPATHWRDTLRSAGYGHIDWTDGDLPESDIQRLIIAHISGDGNICGSKPVAFPARTYPVSTTSHERQAMIDAYVQKYTEDWAVRQQRGTSILRSPSAGSCVLVTGATGSLGSHIVADLAQRSDIDTVICLNRLSHQEANLRQQKSLEARGVRLAPAHMAKLKVIATDTSKPLLGLSQETYNFLVHTVTNIVHSAWPMSLKRPLRGYEIQFKVMRNLLHLAQEAADHRPAPFRFGFQFVSSIAVVGDYPDWAGKALVPEGLTVVDTVPHGGYAEAKVTCEYMLSQTLYQHPDRFHAMAVRIAQISGSAASGHWNPTEYIPILAKSSRSLGALPDIDGTFSWCPVDQVAATMGELMRSSSTATELVYQIDNPSRQSWKHLITLLARLLDISPADIVPHDEWIRRVMEFEGGSASADNPALQLIDFFRYYFLPMSCGGLVLDVQKTCRLSNTLRSMGPVGDELVASYVENWRRSGFL